MFYPVGRLCSVWILEVWLKLFDRSPLSSDHKNLIIVFLLQCPCAVVFTKMGQTWGHSDLDFWPPKPNCLSLRTSERWQIWRNSITVQIPSVNVPEASFISIRWWRNVHSPNFHWSPCFGDWFCQDKYQLFALDYLCYFMILWTWIHAWLQRKRIGRISHLSMDRRFIQGREITSETQCLILKHCDRGLS